MSDKESILVRRFSKLEKHFQALRDYHALIQTILSNENVLTSERFNFIPPRDRAIFDAYIKRFASIQDFLGAKIFPMLVEISGIGSVKMTEVLYLMEREEIIDSIDHWIQLREVRNELEHDYPDELAEALEDLRFCIEHFEEIEGYYQQAKAFAGRYTDALV